MNTLKSQHEKACKVLPGGINSSVRVNNALGTPMYVAKAWGSKILSIEGKEYIDMCCAHGAGLLGNAHPAIDHALEKARRIGYANSFETEYHEELARKVCNAVPCADKVRFCSSGSEATLHMIRVCRGFTGRKKVIRIEGHFHGYHEMIYIGGQPPESEYARNRTNPYIESPGIPEEFANLIVPIPYNDIDALDDAIEKHGRDTALVILEPVNYNSGGIKPAPNYLEYLRNVTKREGILLFFDEIQSCFKNSIGGAQQDFGVIPDVCTIGKALGGGFPLSAFCGRADIMDSIKPVGPVQHSGTFNASLVPVLAGLAFMDEAVKPDFFPALHRLGERLYGGLINIIAQTGANMVLSHHGARFNILLGRKTPAEKYQDTFYHNKKTMIKLVGKMIDQGVYFHDYGGGCAHHGYSIQHTGEDIDNVIEAFRNAVVSLKSENLL